jgi:lipoyl(octanoyl) transferase
MIFPQVHTFQPRAGTTRPARGAGAAWGLVRTWARDAPGQMALDHALAESVWAGRRPPTLRLYGWHAPAVTIGRLQRSGGPLPWPGTWPIIRRWTGGRAVYHQDELTLSLSLPAGHPWIARTVPATYHNVAAPLLAALAALGLRVDDGPTPDMAADRFACFASPTPLEAGVGGRKVMALAQRIAPAGLLAQASLPLGPPAAFGAAARATVGLRSLLPGLTFEALAEAVESAYTAALGAPPEDAPPTGPERDRAADLAVAAYAPLHEGVPRLRRTRFP